MERQQFYKMVPYEASANVPMVIADGRGPADVRPGVRPGPVLELRRGALRGRDPLQQVRRTLPRGVLPGAPPPHLHYERTPRPYLDPT